MLRLINETRKNIIKAKNNNLSDKIMSYVGICENIIGYFDRYDKLSDKQCGVLERFNDSIDNYDFNDKLRKGWEEHRAEILKELDKTVF